MPTVVAFYQGQPVGAFQGVRPKSEIETLAAQLIQMHKAQQPDVIDIPAVLAEAAAALAEKDYAVAQNLYIEILNENPEEPKALAGMIRIFTAMKNYDQASGLANSLSDKIRNDPAVVSALTALELSQNAPGEDWQKLEKQLTDAPETRYAFAEACFAAQEKEKAVDALLSIVAGDRARKTNWEDDKARKTLVKYFEAWGHADPASAAGRRRLSSLLFS